MVVMVQKEVARAITAPPGEMSLLSVAVQFYGEARIASGVSAHSFYPVPKVDSAILKIRLYPQPPLDLSQTDSFFDLVRAGFCANRKQLVNSLSQGLSLQKEEIRPLLEKAAIEPRRRAETLTIAEWVKLWRLFDTEVKPC
jgi:16S rRNA (adenine1518-N6/adenine1519-N6)-dimethyltransferase